MEPNVAIAAKPVKIPGPDHPITIEPNPARIIVSIGGRIVADTREALTLREAAYPAVQYIPRKDVDMVLLDRTDHTTYCPYKGDCAYYSDPAGYRDDDSSGIAFDRDRMIWPGNFDRLCCDCDILFHGFTSFETRVANFGETHTASRRVPREARPLTGSPHDLYKTAR